MLSLDVRFEVRGIGRLVVAVHAGVGLFACVRAHVFLQLGRMPKALPTFHADVREAFAVNSQQVPIEQTLLSSLIVAELAFMHLGGRRRRLVFGLPVVVLESVREQRPLLVELLATHFALEWGLAAKCVHLHVIVEAGFFVGGEVTVCALVLLPGQDILVVVLSVAFEEASRLELFAAKHAGVHGQRLAVGTDDDCWRERRERRKSPHGQFFSPNKYTLSFLKEKNLLKYVYFKKLDKHFVYCIPTLIQINLLPLNNIN